MGKCLVPFIQQRCFIGPIKNPTRPPHIPRVTGLTLLCIPYLKDLRRISSHPHCSRTAGRWRNTFRNSYSFEAGRGIAPMPFHYFRLPCQDFKPRQGTWTGESLGWNARVCLPITQRSVTLLPTDSARSEDILVTFEAAIEAELDSRNF